MPVSIQSDVGLILDQLSTHTLIVDPVDYQIPVDSLIGPSEQGVNI